MSSSAGPPWPWPGPNLLPLGVQEIDIAQLNLPAMSGWMLLVWPGSNYMTDLGAPAAPDYYQTWVGLQLLSPLYGATARDAVVAGHFGCYSDQQLPGLGIDYDYVDATGYTTSPLLTR